MTQGMLMILVMVGVLAIGVAICAYLFYLKMVRFACIILILGLIYVWSFFAVSTTIPVTNGASHSIIRRFPSQLWMTFYRPCMAFDALIYGRTDNDVMWVVLGSS